ncbi:hypothetical protein ACKWTF_012790 [Chironomus riparius]
MPTPHKKNLTPIDDYKFELSKELEEMAKEELRETEEIRQYAIKALRDFIMKNEKIILTRMDAKFLLRYLRFRKFSVPMAEEAIERLLALKVGSYGNNWMNNLNIEKPSVLKLLEAGFIFILPERDYMGRLIIFYRPGVSNAKSPTVGYDILILTTLVYEYLLEDEENQIRGVVHIGDAKNVGMSHFTIFSPQFMCRVGKNTEKTLPMRHKAFHIVNVHRSINFISDAILSRMGEKLKKRVHFYSSFNEFKAIDRSMLPKEYEGTVSMSKMIGKLYSCVKKPLKFRFFLSTRDF